MSDQQNYIRRLRAAMQEKSLGDAEIQKCCEYASALLSKDLPVLFDADHVREVLQLHKINPKAYHQFSLFQIGKIRTITAPSLPLKRRQTWILREILSKAQISDHAHGFETGRSIKTNALVHANHDYVLCLDIQDFFPSIAKKTVIEVFQSLGYSRNAALQLSDVCCYKGTLPQGAPTSPRLSNIIFKSIDEQLSELAEKEHAVYTRYADDLTFSASHPLYDIFEQAKGILVQYGFLLNEDKIHFYDPGQPKRITGLIVQNGTVRVPKRFKRALRQEIHYCTKFGVLTHLENTHALHHINYREHLYGKAYYVYMIEPEVGAVFLDALDEIHWP